MQGPYGRALQWQELEGVAVGKALPPDIPQSTENGPYQCVFLNDVVTPSSKSVWIVGELYRDDGKGHDENQLLLLHWNGKTWQHKSVPGKWTPRRLASDGHGGVWVTGFRSAGGPPADSTPLLHRAANGGWTTVGFTKNKAMIYDLTLIPGTRSLWDVGRMETATRDAAIYHS